ncbi:MAG: NADH:flavin oxidoreductase/NADH oxidase [Aridibacter sp.]
MSKLFEKFKLREIEFRNRIWVSPMCQYSSEDGMPTDWHLVHLGSRAVGGAGLVIVEATAVSPEGRISPQDSGIWSDEHAEKFKRITKFIKEQGAIAGIQIAHAGRKASTAPPWENGKVLDDSGGGWQPVAPTAEKFAEHFRMPKALDESGLEKVRNDFADAAKRAVEAGFEVIEIHNAHGYLLHEFLSPLSNKRNDEYGGSLENRMRFPLEIAKIVRENVPENLPVFVRISASDWTEGGWDIEQSVEFCKELKKIGIDLIDVSSGGNVPNADIKIEAGYQIPFAAEIRKKAAIPTGAVGLVTEPKQAEKILQKGEADAILMAREFLREPYFPFQAARELGGEVDIPKQYGRAIDLSKAKKA